MLGDVFHHIQVGSPLVSGLSSMCVIIFSRKQWCWIIKPVMWPPWVQDTLRPVSRTDVRCQVIIVSLFSKYFLQNRFLYSFWMFTSSNDVSLWWDRLHAVGMLQWSFSHRQGNFVVVSYGLTLTINMSGRHRGWAAGRLWQGRPVAPRSLCILHMLQPPPLHSSAERPELLCWQRSLWWGHIQLHTGHHLLGYAVRCGPWHRQEWLDGPGKCKKKTRRSEVNKIISKASSITNSIYIKYIHCTFIKWMHSVVSCSYLEKSNIPEYN